MGILANHPFEFRLQEISVQDALFTRYIDSIYQFAVCIAAELEVQG